MSVERLVLDPDTRRARSVVRVRFEAEAHLVELGTAPVRAGLTFGPDELAAMNEISATRRALDQQIALIAEYMAARGWPARLGPYWSNGDGSRWEPAQNSDLAPGRATNPIRHPAQLFPERSPERDAFEILLRCESLRGLIQAGADANLVDQAIHLGMLMGRNSFEAQFGRACDIGIGRILSGRKGGRAYADTKEFQRERRLGALQRAIDQAPEAGPSAWARAVAQHWSDSNDPEATARKFYTRHKDKLRHEVPMS